MLSPPAPTRQSMTEIAGSKICGMCAQNRQPLASSYAMCRKCIPVQRGSSAAVYGMPAAAGVASSWPRGMQLGSFRMRGTARITRPSEVWMVAPCMCNAMYLCSY